MRRITSNTRSQEEGREEPPAEPSEGHGRPTPGFWTSSLQNDERIHFYCIKATQFVLICYKKETKQWLNALPRRQSTKYPKLTFYLYPTGMVGTKPGVTLPGFKSAAHWLWDLGQVTFHLCTSVFSPKKWGQYYQPQALL